MVGRAECVSRRSACIRVLPDHHKGTTPAGLHPAGLTIRGVSLSGYHTRSYQRSLLLFERVCTIPHVYKIADTILKIWCNLAKLPRKETNLAKFRQTDGETCLRILMRKGMTCDMDVDMDVGAITGRTGRVSCSTSVDIPEASPGIRRGVCIFCISWIH